MTRAETAVFRVALVVFGAGWGITQPLTKIAVSSGHGHFGLIFWQLVIGAVLMIAIVALRGHWPRPSPAALKTWLIIALIGTVIPNAAGYKAIAHLPSGVVSILLSLVPMAAFPMALALRLEGFSLRRFFGLLVGLCGVLLLVLPKASLPDPAMLAWIPLALVSVFFYAFEGNYVARWGTAGLDAFQVLLGASVLGAFVALPLAIGSGQFIWPTLPLGAPEWALIASSVVHVFVYAGYVWLVGRAGAVFAVQASYLVTGFGVFWAMLLLGEAYSTYIWAAMCLMLVGVFLVQPRPREALAPDPTIRETER